MLLAFATTTFVTGLLYYFGPNHQAGTAVYAARHGVAVHDESGPARCVATTLWLVVDGRLRRYVSHFANYNIFYGTIRTVVVLLDLAVSDRLHFTARLRVQRGARASGFRSNSRLIPDLYTEWVPFKLGIDYQPRGDQATAIEQLTRGLFDGENHQILLGVTGSGKTFTMAKLIEACGRPALVLAHNKTLAAQLYHEFKTFFPQARSSISSATTITTSPKPTFLRATSTSKKKPRSTTSWTSCGFRPPARCSSAATA